MSRSKKHYNNQCGYGSEHLSICLNSAARYIFSFFNCYVFAQHFDMTTLKVIVWRDFPYSRSYQSMRLHFAHSSVHIAHCPCCNNSYVDAFCKILELLTLSVMSCIQILMNLAMYNVWQNPNPVYVLTTTVLLYTPNWSNSLTAVVINLVVWHSFSKWRSRSDWLKVSYSEKDNKNLVQEHNY